jgi:hypothetical protein
MVGTIAGMGRPKKADEAKRVTEQVRLETGLMYMVRFLAVEDGVEAPVWIERVLRPIVTKLYDTLPDRLATKNKAKKKPD